MSETVKFNATGRYTLTSQLLDGGDPLRAKLLDHGIMDPVALTKPELERLVTITDHDPAPVRGTTSWANTRLRIVRAYREVSND